MDKLYEKIGTKYEFTSEPISAIQFAELTADFGVKCPEDTQVTSVTIMRSIPLLDSFNILFTVNGPVKIEIALEIDILEDEIKLRQVSDSRDIGSDSDWQSEPKVLEFIEKKYSGDQLRVETHKYDREKKISANDIRYYKDGVNTTTLDIQGAELINRILQGRIVDERNFVVFQENA